MESLKINTMNELEKLILKRGMKVHFILIALLPFLFLLATEKIITNDMFVMPAVNLSYAMLKGFVLVLIPIFSFVAVSEVFSGEREKGTLFYVRPIGQGDVYLSKLMALGILIAFQLLLFYTVTVVSVLIFGKDFQLSDFAVLFLSTMISWFPLIAVTIFAGFIAQFFKSSGATVGISIFSYVAMFLLPFVFPESLYAFPTSYLDWYQLWNENVSFQWMIQSSIYLFSFSTLFLTGGYYMFKQCYTSQ